MKDQRQPFQAISRRRLLQFAATGSAVGLLQVCAPPPAPMDEELARKA